MSSDRLKRNQRSIIKRVIVKGNLVLDTPTCLGTGDTDSLIDIILLQDSISSHALLTGASIAGALRNYLHDYQNGLDKLLFGATRQDEDGDQSPLIINDSFSTKPIQSELRDGVKIDSITRTAEDKKKYDLELLQAGTEFPLCFELLVEKEDTNMTLIKAIATKKQLAETKYFSTFFFKWLAYQYKNKATLLKALAIALSGLQNHEISLGLKKRRGFGCCHVKEWQVWNFDLMDASDRIAWLTLDHSWSTDPPCTKSPAEDTSIVEAMKKAGLQVAESWEDKRDRFTINATFTLASPLLIRSGQAETGRAPDVVHLKSHRPKKEDENEADPSQQNFVPILSGTSLAGVLRHRAERIVKTLKCSFCQNPECDKEPEIIKSIFGHVENKRSQASRLIVHESTINHTTDLVQTRIAIDRFTGGAYHGALFQEQPVFANDKTELKLEIELRNPEQHEIGLLLLLLKDLWTEDLPVGSSSSIGRGRLQGKEATLIWEKEQKSWKISQPNLKKNSLEITGSDRQDLENYVNKLVEYSQQETTKNDQA